jgi:hypothetical protein
MASLPAQEEALEDLTSSALRCVYVSPTPFSSYQATAFSIPSLSGTLASQPKSFFVREGSSRIEGASSGGAGRTSTSSASSIPIASTTASNISLIE